MNHQIRREVDCAGKDCSEQLGDLFLSTKTLTSSDKQAVSSVLLLCYFL